MGRRLRCIGGPLDDQYFEPRFPRGFILVNKAAGQVNVYRAVSNHYVADGPVRENTDQRRAMANDPRFDVVAYDPERMGLW